MKHLVKWSALAAVVVGEEDAAGAGAAATTPVNCDEDNAVMVLEEFEGETCETVKRTKYLCDFRPKKDKKKPDCWMSKDEGSTKGEGMGMQCSADGKSVKIRRYKDEVCNAEDTTELDDEGDHAEMPPDEVAVMTMGGCGKGEVVDKDGKKKGKKMSMKRREGKGRKHHRMAKAAEEMGGEATDDILDLIDPDEDGVRSGSKGGFGKEELDEMIKNCKGKGKGRGKKPPPKGGKGGGGKATAPEENANAPNAPVGGAGNFLGADVTDEMKELIDWEKKAELETSMGVDVFSWNAGDATACVEESIDVIVTDMVALYTAGNTQEGIEIQDIQMDTPNTMPDTGAVTNTDYEKAIENALGDAMNEVAGSSCFAGSAKVETLQGNSPISSLKVGDVIRTASGFEPIVGFLHAEKGTTNFVELSTTSGVLPVTPDHLVFLANGQAVPAASIKVGDSLSSGVVTEINHVVRSDGIYSPITKSGTIVVEGNVASTYAAAHESLSHSISHIMTAPLRWLGVYTSPAVDRKIVATVYQSSV